MPGTGVVTQRRQGTNHGELRPGTCRSPSRVPRQMRTHIFRAALRLLTHCRGQHWLPDSARRRISLCCARLTRNVTDMDMLSFPFAAVFSKCRFCSSSLLFPPHTYCSHLRAVRAPWGTITLDDSWPKGTGSVQECRWSGHAIFFFKSICFIFHVILTCSSCRIKHHLGHQPEIRRLVTCKYSPSRASSSHAKLIQDTQLWAFETSTVEAHVKRAGAISSIPLLVRGVPSRDTPILILDVWNLGLLQSLFANAFKGRTETAPK